jgi:hypothetical protein
MKKYLFLIAAASAILLMGAVTSAMAQFPFPMPQTRYARGQDVGPTYEGWDRNPDGTFNLHFGYYNRNAEEDLDVPIGPENNIDGSDKGQPTHFYPGRRWWAFTVKIPQDWPKDKRVVWTLVTHGVTNQAKGWLQPEWEMDSGVIVKNSGRDPFLMSAGGAGEADFDNKPPTITGSTAQTVTLPNTLMITATARDDGRPMPPPDNKRPFGMRMRWIVWRGNAKNVKFEPDIMQDRIYGQPATLQTKVTFTAPGEYQLRAIASDGQLTSTYNVDVTVKGAGASN